MPQTPRPVAFILASTDHGTMIVNRFDINVVDRQHVYGVGFSLLNQSYYEPEEADIAMTLLDERRRHFGDGVTVLDIGANIGVFTVEWAKYMTGWGQVVAFEAQERIFQALAGNVAINNCFNARTVCAAVTDHVGTMKVPLPNYLTRGSFGSLELRRSDKNENIGQPIDYDEARMITVPAVSVDSLDLPRVDLMKVDVEGMELEVLEGARRTIGAHRPILVLEKLKADENALREYARSFGYQSFDQGLNIVAIHADDPTAELARRGPMV